MFFRVKFDQLLTRVTLINIMSTSQVSTIGPTENAPIEAATEAFSTTTSSNENGISILVGSLQYVQKIINKQKTDVFNYKIHSVMMTNISINRFTIVAENLKLLHKAASENRKTIQFQLLYNKCCWLSVFINLH